MLSNAAKESCIPKGLWDTVTRRGTGTPSNAIILGLLISSVQVIE
jgi:hypothetical protein